MLVGLALSVRGPAAIAGGAHYVRRAIGERRRRQDWAGAPGRGRRFGVFALQQMGAMGTRLLRCEARYEYEVEGKRLRGLLYSNYRRHFAALKAKYPPG